MATIDHLKQNYISAVDAARQYGLTNDHVAFLVRKGRVEGVLVGRVRYVDEESLKEYLRRTEEEKSVRHRRLSQNIKREQLQMVPVERVVSFVDSHGMPLFIARAKFAAAFAFLFLGLVGTTSYAMPAARSAVAFGISASEELSSLSSKPDLMGAVARMLPAMPQREEGGYVVATETIVTPTVPQPYFGNITANVHELATALTVAAPQEPEVSMVQAVVTDIQPIAHAEPPPLGVAYLEYLPQEILRTLARAHDATFGAVARTVVGDLDYAGTQQAQVFAALGAKLADVELGLMRIFAQMQASRPSANAAPSDAAVARTTLVYPTLPQPYFGNIIQNVHDLAHAFTPEPVGSAALERGGYTEAGVKVNAEEAPTALALNTIDWSFLPYLPEEIASISTRMYDDTFNTFARAYVAGVYNALEQQVAVYRMLGEQLGTLEAAVVASVPILAHSAANMPASLNAPIGISHQKVVCVGELGQKTCVTKQQLDELLTQSRIAGL